MTEGRALIGDFGLSEEDMNMADDEEDRIKSNLSKPDQFVRPSSTYHSKFDYKFDLFRFGIVSLEVVFLSGSRNNSTLVFGLLNWHEFPLML